MKPVVTWIVFALLPVFIAFFVCVSYNQFLIGIVGLAASFSGLAFALEQKLSRRPATVIVVSGDINARRMGTIRARLSTLFQLFPETIRVRLIKLFPETIRVRLIELFPKRHTIEFVTDGRFIDSALFQLAVKEASKKIYDIDVVVRQYEWRSIPSYIRRENAIGYFNRRSIQNEKRIYPSLKVWGDLCIYKGYALIGRTDDFKTTPKSIAKADQALDRLLTERKQEGREAKLISMGADTRWRFESPALKSYSKERIEFIDVNADEALKRFKSGEADLFIGGLPQRLSLRENADFVEIVSSDLLPTLFSVNSLIYNSEIPKSGKLAMRKIFDAWCKLVVEMQDPEVAHRRYREWEKLTSGFDLGTKTINETTWKTVFSDKGRQYIEFIVDEERKVELHTIKTLKWCVHEFIEESQLSDSEKIQILADLSKTYSVHLKWFFQFIEESQLTESKVLQILRKLFPKDSASNGASDS